MISGVKITSMDDVIKAGRRIIELGVENAVITLGEKGAMIVTKETHVHVPGVKVKPVDTTGAGDAFNGALAVALAEGRSLEEAVKFANYAAALKITKVGAQTGLPTRSELEEFINQYKEST